MDSELDRFKCLDLRAYAETQGYRLDRKESWRGSAVMRQANGDKIVISRQPDGHYTFYSFRADDDSGTIIDFIRNRKGMTLGAIRRELRAWQGQAPAAPMLPEPLAVAKDRASVQRRYELMVVAHRHPYLEYERAIPALTLRYWRFDGRVKMDSHANAVFPHYDHQGVCGFELRNFDFKGFARGGTKGLWLSKTSQHDRRLIICESAIDALSHSVLFPDGHARYASLSGRPSPLQLQLLRAQIGLLASGAEVVAATDADAAGRGLAEMIKGAFEVVQRADLNFRRQEPAGFKDWNERLQNQSRCTRRPRCEEPSIL
jgi:hypothetical protein